MPNSTLHIIASCSDRKTASPRRELRLRSIARTPAKRRVDLWRDALQEWGKERIEAKTLYCGEHWAVSRRIFDAALQRGFHPRLWVISAGHGLIAAEDLVSTYSATFSPYHPDTTDSPDSAAGDWWKHLTATSPRTGATQIADLAAGSRDHLLVICSPEYLRHVEADLLNAQNSAKQRLFIVSSLRGTRLQADSRLHDSLLLAEAKLRLRFGGSLTSLNARLALDIVDHSRDGRLDIAHSRNRLKRLMSDCPNLPQISRQRLTDDELERLILAALKKKATPQTRLLKVFRKNGLACEQSRFRKLFKRVRLAP